MNRLQRTKAMRGFLSGLIDLIWSRNAREDGMEALPAMQPLF